MKSGIFSLAAVLLVSVALVGCKSKEDPTVKTGTLGSNYTYVKADVPTTTAAAESVLKEMGLKDVTSSSTTVDGKATAKTANDTTVTVSVRAKGEKGTEIDAKVGMGYSDLSQKIVMDTKKKLGE